MARQKGSQLRPVRVRARRRRLLTDVKLEAIGLRAAHAAYSRQAVLLAERLCVGGDGRIVLGVHDRDRLALAISGQPSVPGRPMRSGMRCAVAWSPGWGTRAACWSPMRPGSSRRAGCRRACNGSTPARPILRAPAPFRVSMFCWASPRRAPRGLRGLRELDRKGAGEGPPPPAGDVVMRRIGGLYPVVV